MSFLEFENGIGRRARLWLDDLPKAALLHVETIYETHAFVAHSATASRRSVAMEIFQPLGASFHYGLLGGEYKPGGGSELKVNVPIGAPFSQLRYRDPLTRSLDTVTVGSLPEYAKSICSGLQQVGIDTRPSGVLNITCMAHGEIGSASSVFMALARALIRALSREEPTSLAEAMALLAA